MTARLAAFALGSMVALGLAPSASAQAPVERHDWILLVDASGSFRDGGDRDVRNEALVQLQTLLAVAAERNPAAKREDRLKAYRFGTGVEPILVQDNVLTWENVKSAVRWDSGLDKPRFGARSDYVTALKRAKADLEARPESARQHVILISDGDLDVGSQLRRLGAPPAPEEIEAYGALLAGRSLLDWFVERDIKIHTFYVRPAHQRAELTDDQIAQRLKSCAGANIALKLFAMIEQMPRGCASGIGQSEGAYAMFAIAGHTGAEFHQVTDASFVSSLQAMVMPDLQSDIGIPPGTRQLYLVVRRGDSAEVKATNSRGRPVEVRIPPSGNPEISPSGALRVDKIEGPLSVIYRLGGDLAEGGSPSRVQKLSTTGLTLQWITPGRRAPLSVYTGRETTIAVSLRKSEAETRKTVAEWREFFRGKGKSLKVTGTIQAADSTEKREIVFKPRPETSSADSILDFEYRLPPLGAGRWEFSVRIQSEDPAESWVQTSDDVAEIKVIPVPDLRVGTTDEAGRLVGVQPAKLASEKDQVDPTVVPAGFNLKRLLEIWQPADGTAPDLTNLKITLNLMSLEFRGPAGALRVPEARGGNLRVIWRSDAVQVDSAISRLEIVIDTGAGPLYGALQIPPPPNAPQWTIQSGLMNADGPENCPSRPERYFHIQQESELVLSRGGSTTRTHIAAPQGDLPVCLIYRWKNYESFKGKDWALDIMDGGQSVGTRHAEDGGVDPESATVWKSTPVSIPRIALLRGRLETHLRVGDQVYIAQHTIDRVPQGEPKAYFCLGRPSATPPHCQPLEAGQTTTVQPSGSEPFEAFLELRMAGIPNGAPEWRVIKMNHFGRFKVGDVDVLKKSSVLRTDPISIQNVQSAHTIRIDQHDYQVLVDKGYLWRGIHFATEAGEKIVILHHSVVFLLAFYGLLTAIITLGFSIVGLRKSRGVWKPWDLFHFETYKEESHHAAGWLSDRVRNLTTGPGDRFEFRLFQPGNPDSERFVLPARWKLNTYLVRTGGRLKLKKWLSPPTGACLRLYITNSDTPDSDARFNLETENGPWIVHELPIDKTIHLASGRPPYSVGIRRFSRLRLRLEVAEEIEPPPRRTTIQCLGPISKADSQKTR
jgi:hypothetical protein